MNLETKLSAYLYGFSSIKAELLIWNFFKLKSQKSFKLCISISPYVTVKYVNFIQMYLVI